MIALKGILLVSKKSKPLLIVGVGASAGGLEALKQFFKSVPKDAPIAFIVVQHLDPNHKSMMADILSRHAPLSFCQAKDKQTIEAGCAYMIPPNAFIEVIDNTIQIIAPQQQLGSRLSIDHLFRSMAEQYKSKAVGIIFSGSGSDGTAGLRALKAAGGLALVQKPKTAEHQSMPRSAIEAGVVDQALDIEDMFELLLNYAKHPYHELTAEEAADEDTLNLKSIASILKAEENFILDQYKDTTVQRRLYRRMGLTANSDQKSYLQLLQNSQEERQMLMRDLLINVTDFFRDKDAFDILNHKVIEKIVAEADEGTQIRVWIAGCASGEEAYSVAILFFEQFECSGKNLTLKIFATDVDEEIITKARKGIYPSSIVSELPIKFLDKYFLLHNDGYYAVRSDLRECISFAIQNVYIDPPFSKLHLVCCRNLLIYLKNSVQQKVLKSFYFSLLPHGFLFLGSSENLGGRKKLFNQVSQKWRIFCRTERRDASSKSSVVPSFFDRSVKLARIKKPKQPEMSQNDKLRASLLAALNASVILDENNTVVYFHGKVNKYLQLPDGEAELNFFNMLDPSQRTRIRSGIFKAKKSDQIVSVNSSASNTLVGQDKTQYRAIIIAIPESDNSVGSVIISFEDVYQVGGIKSPVLNRLEDSRDQETMINAMEHELVDTKEELQNTVEELETITEELKAAHEEALTTNEELQSSNEELEASTEELRSLNEELTTVNVELKDKISELSTTHDDISNLFASTNLATVFLSNQLHVKRYTPAAERLLRLGIQDIDRPLSEISHQIIDQDTLEDAMSVLESLEPIEKEIELDSQWFLQKVLPYKTKDRRVDGVVLTFSDITHLKSTVTKLQVSGQQHAVIARLGIEALNTDDIENFADRVVREIAHTLNADFSKVLEYFPDKGYLLLKAGFGWDAGLIGEATITADNSSQAGYTLNTPDPVIVENLAKEQRFIGPTILTDHRAVSGMSCIIENGAHPYGVLSVYTKKLRHFSQDDSNFLMSAANILSVAIHRKKIELQLRENEKRLRIAKDSNQMASFEYMIGSGENSWDNMMLDIWGLSEDEVNQKNFEGQLHPDDVAHVNEAINKATAQSGDGHYKATYRVINKMTKKLSWVEASGQVMFEKRIPIKMFGMVIDVTDKMNLESSLKIAVNQLQKADEKKNEFIATLGHEIRNPLAAIGSGLQIIDQDPTQLSRALSMIENNTGVISALLDDLLDLTRISRGQIELKKQVVQVKELLTEIYHGFLPKFEKKQQKTSLVLAEDNITASLDKVRIHQAINNVINNAHKFTPELGSIQIELRHSGNQFEISIKDTGIGLDATMKEKIFQPFQQVNYTSSRGNSGMGIGLSLVKQFAELHEGTITVNSDGLGTGSEFILTLPLMEQTSEEKAIHDANLVLDKRPISTENFDLLRVLIVDDNEDATFGLAIILQTKGCQVTSCIDGKTAQSEYIDFKPNVLILDIGLPDMTGHELLGSLKKLKPKGKELCIALTGYGHKEARDKSIEAGFDFHLNKPVNLEDLLRILSDRTQHILSLS